MKSFFDYTLEDLTLLLENNGYKKYNALQICEWIYKKKEYDIDNFSNLSKNLREFLKQNLDFELLKLVECQKSKDTSKYLLELQDTNKIECVLMYHDYGNSLCISTQIGCNMGCSFCESGLLLQKRNLLVSEIILQVITIENLENIRIDNIVVMGIGEPFDNYNNLIKSLDIMTNANTINLGRRKITVSTCGIVPKIYEFADLSNGVNLAISLHAPNDIIRDKLMKINKVYKIKDIMNALDYYICKTNRRVTIEYILIKDINDTEECAYDLAKLLNEKLVYVNLIPYNETKNNDYKKSEIFKINKFYDILKKKNINVTRRKEMGPKIDAACGQLSAHYKEE